MIVAVAPCCLSGGATARLASGINAATVLMLLVPFVLIGLSALRLARWAAKDPSAAASTAEEAPGAV
ncbi:MAG: hypothetical protein U0166_09550 [Acidobacteriota bacterium]